MPLETPNGSDRRTSPRLQLISYIVGELDTGDEVSLVNISEGGLMVRGRHETAVGEVHEFRFLPEGEAPLVFAASVVHVKKLADSDPPEFETGLRFVARTARHQAAIRRLLNAVAGD